MAQLEHIEAIEKRLWSAADTLRANSNYASNEYFLPVMGLVFLRHAYSRFLGVKDAIEAGLPTRGGKTRPLTKEDFSQKSAIFLQPKAQFDTLVALPDSADRAKAIIDAMESIEADYENLRGVLPKSEYQELDNAVLGQLMRTLNPEELKRVSGDVFGRIYEYFLTQFADQKAHDGGEFFTPVSLVSLIANVIEPADGTVLDPACGSGGMFVQSARVVERRHENPTEKLTFYGLEKNATTNRLAKMNLAVHGLEGDIQKSITYYEDPHELLRKADFVMANPPFNVDEIDADKVGSDPRLPFGLPGVNKKGKVSNGNYVWISYFYSYLNEQGRAGFVMSSQASSAGRDEAKVRRKLVETGDVDVMVAIRSNFFYTRTVPCELWFIDRGKPDQPSSPALLPRGEGSHYRGGYDFSGLGGWARELRKKQTPAEQVLWEMLRDRQLLGFNFRRQHQVGDYILDFYCHEAKLAVELDGVVHEQRLEKDAKRDAYLKSQGIQVLRISNDTLLHKTVSALKQIADLLPSPTGRWAGGEGRFSGPLNRKGHVLMIDARNIYRKVTRKIYDFSPEQEQNLLAIVWLYRGETGRYLELVAGYCRRMLAEGAACFAMKNGEGETVEPLPVFIGALATLRCSVEPFLKTLAKDAPYIEPLKELDDAIPLFKADVDSFRQIVTEQQAAWGTQKTTNGELKKAVDRLATLAETSRDLVKQTDLLYKEWFVHLRFPGHEHTQIIDGVPAGWEKKPLGELLTLQRGFDLPVSKRKEGRFPIYASTGINGYHAEAKVKGPGVVTGRSGSLGTAMYVSGDFWPLNTTLWVKEFKLVGPHYANHLLANMQLEQYNGGAAVPTLNRNDVHRVEVLSSPSMLLRMFEDQSNDIVKQIDALTSMNLKLAEARDLLLPKLMNGEVTV